MGFIVLDAATTRPKIAGSDEGSGLACEQSLYQSAALWRRTPLMLCLILIARSS